MPLSPSTSCHADDLSGAERIETVDEGDADLDFGGLSVRVSCGDALAEGLEAPHFRLDPAPDMVSGPPLPERPAIVPGGAKGFVSGDCRRTAIFPRPPVFADRDDRRGLTVDDGGVATACVIRPIGGHGADLFALGDLVEQFRQDRTVTIAAGSEFHGADVRQKLGSEATDIGLGSPRLRSFRLVTRVFELREANFQGRNFVASQLFENC